MKEHVPLGIVIATREREFVLKHDFKERALVSIGQPVAASEPECWYCPYLIEAGTTRTQRHAVGIDAVHLSRPHSGDFTFLGFSHSAR